VEDDVKVLRDRNKSTPKAANARLTVLNHLFVWATDKHESGIAHNPARDVRKLKLLSNEPGAENTFLPPTRSP